MTDSGHSRFDHAGETGDSASEFPDSERMRLAARPLDARALRDDLVDLFRIVREYRKEIIVLVTVVTVLIARRAYPLPDRHWSAFVYFGVVPLIVAFALGFRARALGLGLGNVRAWLPLTALLIITAVPLVWLGAQMSSMQAYYGQSEDWDILYAVYTTGVYHVAWEFFYRGFMLFTLAPRFREFSIVIQMVPFVLTHLGKPPVEALSCVFSGLIWGYVCYRGGSFWPAFIMHFTVNFANQIFNHVA